MKKISFYLKKYWYLYTLALFCLFIYEFLDMVSPQVTRRIIDDVIMGGQTNLLPWLILMLVIVGVGRVAGDGVVVIALDAQDLQTVGEVHRGPLPGVAV